jgi:hypothetical protein
LAQMLLKLVFGICWVLRCSATDLDRRSPSALVISPSEYLYLPTKGSRLLFSAIC